jgi:hypothetical protein
MIISLFSYRWTYLLAPTFLGSVLWSTTFCDGWSFLVVLSSFLFFVASTIACIVLAVKIRPKEALYRGLIGVFVVLLFFPTANLGGFLRDRLFLLHLARFQEVTNRILDNERSKTKGGELSIAATIPPGYSNLNVRDTALVSFAEEGFTVGYAMRDSSALGHSGYMYRSDDNPMALSKEFPYFEYTRVAPHWFFYSD